jgi:hypothetical protein
MPERPKRDPIRAFQRKAVAARRVGENARCACGEARAEALIPGSDPITCAKCQRTSKGQSITDDHHIAGKANSPVTIQVPVNDHRADLSIAQYDWPMNTLKNPTGSPLLKAAACVRGASDTIFYIIQTLLLWIPDMLEMLDSLMTAMHGDNWWRGTELEQFAPENSSNVE